MICLHASELASIVGKNKYEPTIKTLIKVWRRHDAVAFRDLSLDHANFRKLCQQHGFPLQDKIPRHIQKVVSSFYYEQQKEQKACSATDLAKQVVKLTAQGVEVTPTVLEAELTKAALVQPDQKADSGDPEAVAELVKAMHTHSGKRDEERILNQVSASRCAQISERNATHYSKSWSELGFQIIGFVDGIDREKQILHEVKRRQNRLFYKVPEYEFVQVQVYLELCDLRSALHSEDYNGRRKDTTIERSRDYFNSLLPEIAAFAAKIKQLVEQLDIGKKVELLESFAKN